jgi:hypothetical protein
VIRGCILESQGGGKNYTKINPSSRKIINKAKMLRHKLKWETVGNSP